MPVCWTLSRSDHQLVCTERQSHDAVEVQITLASLPISQRRYASRDDASRWTAQQREAWEACGWRPAADGQ
jgi:hypothetical protein